MAFYDRMADTATRLLTKFGKSVTFQRVTSVFNPITGMDTSRTTETIDTVGVEIPINQALIDGTRVQSDDKFIVIDASFEPMMSDRLMVGLNPPVVSCAYPMDASLAEIQAILPMIDAVPVMTDDFQTATYTLTGSAPAGDWEVLCAPTITPPGPATVDFSSGVKAFEWAYSIPTLTVPAAQQVVMSSILKLVYANNFSNGLIDIHIDTEISGGVQITRMQVRRLGTAVSSYIDVPNTGRISVEMDADTGTFSVISHEVGIIPLSDNSYNPATPCIFSLLFNEYYGVDPVHIGKEATVSLVTNASDMTGTYPPGTTDICGNPLAKDVSESWAIVAIEPINPAGTPVAYRVQVRK